MTSLPVVDCYSVLHIVVAATGNARSLVIETLKSMMNDGYYDSAATYRARLLPFDAIRREQKMNTSIFLVVVSQSNRKIVIQA